LSYPTLRTSNHITACGLDFGTSNSTLAYSRGLEPALVPLEDGKSTVPSAVFFGHDKADAFLVGSTAVNAYVDGAPGRLMRALKSILGNALVKEQTPIYRRKISFADIIGQYLSTLKNRAEKHLDCDLTQVVLGRPVQFVDNDDEANRFAEKTLGDIAKSIGFKDVSFQFEPVAAALEFERQITTEKLALIADIGGGTSDFSVVRLAGSRPSRDRKADVLSNAGVRVGGTDFDRYLSISNFMPHFGYKSLQKRGDIELPSAPFWDLSTWSSIHNLYEPKFMTQLKAMRYDAQRPELLDRLIYLVGERRCHSLLMEVENVKMELSQKNETQSDLQWIAKNLHLIITRESFEHSAQSQYDKLKKTLSNCIADAGLYPSQIDVIFFTGGTSMIPSVREAITQGFENAERVNGDQFGAVGLGLGIEAYNRYG
jgi:hypothetical chaperone protein